MLTLTAAHHQQIVVPVIRGITIVPAIAQRQLAPEAVALRCPATIVPRRPRQDLRVLRTTQAVAMGVTTRQAVQAHRAVARDAITVHRQIRRIVRRIPAVATTTQAITVHAAAVATEAPLAAVAAVVAAAVVAVEDKIKKCVCNGRRAFNISYIRKLS